MDREQMRKIILAHKMEVEAYKTEHPDPQDVVIYLENSSGERKGHIKYEPMYDTLKISINGAITFDGDMIKSLFNALKTILGRDAL